MMKFQHCDEALKSALAINQELRFMAVFGEMTFPARATVRHVHRRGVVTYLLNDWLATTACSVPTNCEVTHYKPTSQLGMDAIRELQKHYLKMTIRKKEKQTPAEKRMQEFADKMIK